MPIFSILLVRQIFVVDASTMYERKVRIVFFYRTFCASFTLTHIHTHAHKRNIKKEKRENGEKSGKNRKRQNERRRSLGKFFAFVAKWRHIYIRRKKLETKWNEREDDCWKKSFRTRYEIMKYWRKRGKNGKNGKLRDKRENNCWKKLYIRCKISVHFLVKKDLILLL